MNNFLFWIQPDMIPKRIVTLQIKCTLFHWQWVKILWRNKWPHHYGWEVCAIYVNVSNLRSGQVWLIRRSLQATFLLPWIMLIFPGYLWIINTKETKKNSWQWWSHTYKTAFACFNYIHYYLESPSNWATLQRYHFRPIFFLSSAIFLLGRPRTPFGFLYFFPLQNS